MLVIHWLKRQVSCLHGTHVCLEITWGLNEMKPAKCAREWHTVSVHYMGTFALTIIIVITIIM